MPTNNTNDNPQENPEEKPESPDEEPVNPIDPPREPTPEESDLLSSIGYSITTACEQTLSSIVAAIDTILEKSNNLISGQPYNINYSNNGTSVIGYITINRYNSPETWEATITSFSITGTNNNIDYKIYGNAKINSDYQSSLFLLPFINCEINIVNYTGANTNGWYGALITEGTVKGSIKGPEIISIDVKANDDKGDSHNCKASAVQINETTIEQSQTLDGISLAFPS